MNNLGDKLTAMEKDRDHWKAVALYLADCHAATAEGDALLKSVSVSRKKRLFSICRKAADMLSGRTAAPPLQTLQNLDRILTRLRGAEDFVP